MAVFGEKYIGEPYEAQVNGQTVTIYAYFPDGIEKGATVNGAFYWPGAGGYVASADTIEYIPISDYYTNNDNVDYIFFSFRGCEEFNDMTDEAIQQVITQIQKDKNITIDINSVWGFSAGGDEAVKCTLNILRNDPAAEQQKIMVYDPYSRYSGFGYNFKEDDIKLLQDNESEVFLIVGDYRVDKFRNVGYTEGAFINNLASNKIPTVIISGKFGHTTENAIYDGWIDYINGNIELEEIKSLSYDGEKYSDKLGYQVSVPVVGEDGQVTWQIYKLTDLVDAKLHPENYSKEQLSGMNYAIDSLDDMRVEVDAEALIRRADSLLSYFSTYLDTAPTVSDYSSTSKLIPAQFEALTAVRDVLAKVRDSAQKEIKKAVHAGDEYIKLEEEITKNTESLNQLLNDKLTDLKTPFVKLEVEIDDPDLKKKSEKASGNTGGYYYSPGGGGNGTTTQATTISAEVPETKVTPDNKPEVIQTVDSRPAETGATVGSPVHSTVTVTKSIDNEPLPELDTPEPETKDIDTPPVVDDQPVNDEPRTDTPIRIINEKGNNNKGNFIKAAGVVATAGAAVAAGVYGAKKIKEKQEEREYASNDDDAGSSYDIDKKPSNNDEI